MKKLFRPGGPHEITQTGPDQYTMNLKLPTDADGRLARECVSGECSPGYFKVKGGTGLSEQTEAFCPYCRSIGEPSDFTTQEQIRYAKDVAMNELRDGVADMFGDALDLGPSGRRRIGGGMFSIEMSLKQSPKPIVHRPFEDEVRRDVVCPHCGLDHSVYGVATWCADCGADIFLTHVDAEHHVVRIMLSDVDRRRQEFGVRVASKDLENCLEDTVSIFEAVLRLMFKRALSDRGRGPEAVEQMLHKAGNAFQSIGRATEKFSVELGIAFSEGVSVEDLKMLSDIFQKRHPIAHNLGVVDKKYIQQAEAAEEEGREVLVTKAEIERAVAISSMLFRFLHTRLFQDTQQSS